METSNPILWIIGTIVAFVVAMLANEKRKTGRARAERDAAEQRAVEAETRADVETIKREHDDSRDESGSAWFGNWLHGPKRPK